jgi:cytochrome c peroxidase
MRWWALAAGTMGSLALVAASLALPNDLAPLRPDELASIASLGPWPPPALRDSSNRVSGHVEAVALGEALFHSTRLSTVGGVRCATCHEPWRRFTDGRARALGAEAGARNTPSVLNLRLQHWFGWDGANDSLWSQSIRPMLDSREMRSDAAHVAQALRDDETLKRLYALAFGHAAPADDESALVDAAKALAAYQETLVSDRTPFDAFRDALIRGDGAAAARYPVAAQRGLRVFIGRGQCISCHAGPNFSDGEFHPSRIASKLHDGTPDRGRALGLEKLLASPYARAGRFSDDKDAAARPASAPAEPGAFRTPGLREVSATAPYMHDGSIANLCDALHPHATFPGRSAPALTLAERRDLVAFLRTLDAREEAVLTEQDATVCR